MEIFQIVRFGEPENYYLLINKLDINTVDSDSSNLLHAAISYSRFEIAMDLLSRGIDVNRQNKEGKTALHYVAENNPAAKQTLDLANEILRRGGNVNLQDKWGNNALWTATFNARGNYELVKLFKENGGEAFSRNNNNKAALDFAQQINDKNLISLLTDEI